MRPTGVIRTAQRVTCVADAVVLVTERITRKTKETQMSKFKVGDVVKGGSGADKDYGHVVARCKHGVKVAWSSGVTTCTPTSILKKSTVASLQRWRDS